MLFLQKGNLIPKLCGSKEMRSAKRLRIKSLQKTQEYSKGLASIPACLRAGQRFGRQVCKSF